MGTYSKFVPVRMEPHQLTKLQVLSARTGELGNVSAAMRMLVDQAKLTVSEIYGEGEEDDEPRLYIDENGNEVWI